MIKWLKSLFEPSDSGRMVPISQIEADRAREKREEQEMQDEILDIESQIKEYDNLNEEIREYVYMGDGMMEEVVRKRSPAEEHLDTMMARNPHMRQAATRNASTSTGYIPSYSPAIYSGSDYDSGSSYSSCDSGSSSSCD